MKLRIKSIVVLFLFSLLILCACSGCSSSDTQTAIKLISAKGEVEGLSIQSSYSYDSHDRLKSLYTKSIMDDFAPVKAVAPSSAETGLEYRVEYDDNGNITQIQLWREIFDEGELIASELFSQLDYTYVDNRLTESVESRLDIFSRTEYRKNSYDYNDTGDLITIQSYLSENLFNKSFAATPSQILTMTYDVNKNLIQVENKTTGTPDSGNTYVMTYNADNQMVKHEKYIGVDLTIDDSSIVDDTFELVYDTIANTVTVTNTDDTLYSTVLSFLGKDIGYLNPTALHNIRVMEKTKAARPMVSSGVNLIPSELMQLLSISVSDDNYRNPIELLAAKQLIIENTYLYTGDTPTETTYFDTVIDENGYPQTMMCYTPMTGVDFDINFTWE